MKQWAGCQPKDSAVRQLKDEAKNSDESPLSRCEKELEKRELVSRFYESSDAAWNMKQFSAAKHEQFRVVTNEIIEVAASHGIKIAFSDIGDMLRRMKQRHLDQKDLHTCTCCNGTKAHVIPVREAKDLREETHDCKTCDATGSIPF